MVNNKVSKVLFLLVLLVITGYLIIFASYTKSGKNDIQSISVNITEEEVFNINQADKKEERLNNNIVFEYYDKDDCISLDNAFPISDELGKDNLKYFKLRFNKNALGVKYVITVEKIIDSTLDDEYAKLYLVSDKKIDNCYRDNNEIKTFNEYSKYNSSSNERIIYENTITSNDINRGYKEFIFRMWLSSSLDLENSNYLSEAKTYNIKINVYAIKE